MSESGEKVQFKPPKRKNLRQRRQSSDDEAPAEDQQAAVQSKLEMIHETKEKQKLRVKPNGVTP